MRSRAPLLPASAETPDGGFDGGQGDANTTDLGTTDAGTADLGATDAVAADAGPLAACLESPDDLPRPPTDRLPCDLILPNFGP